MTLPLRVLGDRVLVQPDRQSNAPETLASGVIVATSLAAAVTGEDASHSVNRGTVIAVGNPRHPKRDEVLELTGAARFTAEDVELLRDLVAREPCCQVGDDVLFAYDAGQTITVEGTDYILLHETDLLAVVEPEQEIAPPGIPMVEEVMRHDR